jgi:hypothetical protein
MLAESLGRVDLAEQFLAARGSLAPEEIDDGVETAPSKRIGRITKYKYEKVLAGTRAAAASGIPRISQECPHFRAWLEWLETLTEL